MKALVTRNPGWAFFGRKAVRFWPAGVEAVALYDRALKDLGVGALGALGASEPTGSQGGGAGALGPGGTVRPGRLREMAVSFACFSKAATCLRRGVRSVGVGMIVVERKL